MSEKTTGEDDDGRGETRRFVFLRPLSDILLLDRFALSFFLTLALLHLDIVRILLMLSTCTVLQTRLRTGREARLVWRVVIIKDGQVGERVFEARQCERQRCECSKCKS